VVIGGELFVGDQFAAGEIGHVVVDDEGALCKCGKRGCLEAIVSAPLLAQRLNGVGERDRARHLELAGRHLGIVLAALVGALNLSQIVLSGPMDLLDDRFRLAAIDTIRNRTFPNVGQHVSVRFSSLGDDGVLLGAAALVLRNELGIV
jgi:predicted NBD/HSP70 family sugar kinase